MIFNKVLSRMPPFRDTDFGRIRPNFKCTVYFFSGRWLILLNLLQISNKKIIAYSHLICKWFVASFKFKSHSVILWQIYCYMLHRAKISHCFPKLIFIFLVGTYDYPLFYQKFNFCYDLLKSNAVTHIASTSSVCPFPHTCVFLHKLQCHMSMTHFKKAYSIFFYPRGRPTVTAIP